VSGENLAHPPRRAPVSGFVVKAIASSVDVSWISTASLGGFPVLGSRPAADVFKTRVDAYAAIDLLPYMLDQAGVYFSIEPTG
jgi:hypothetical protein